MINLRLIVCCSIVIVTVMTACEGKEWRGIVPLQSWRTDVVRLLGPPLESNELRSMYRLEREDVYIVFSGRQFCDQKTTNIPAGTVLLIQVTPRVSLSVVDLQLNKDRLKVFSPALQDQDWKGFIDEEEGLIVRSFKEKVDKIFYFAAAKNRSLCPSYYAKPEDFARIVLDFPSGPFDRYSDLVFADEKARLDNFAIYLQREKPTWKAYVVGYPAAHGAVPARTRMDRAKRYLISIGLDENRVVTIMGGRQNTVTIELYALPPDSPAPTPNPSADSQPTNKIEGRLDECRARVPLGLKSGVLSY